MAHVTRISALVATFVMATLGGCKGQDSPTEGAKPAADASAAKTGDAAPGPDAKAATPEGGESGEERPPAVNAPLSNDTNQLRPPANP